MITLVDLWLPILVSAVLVFVVSSVVHMVLPLHKGDYGKLPDEDRVLDALAQPEVKPGQYMFPCPVSMKDMSSPEMLDKYRRGPVGFVTIVPKGPPRMGKSLVAWFVYSLVISLFAGYVAEMAAGRDASFLSIFRLTSTVAILGYGVSYIPNAIWKGEPWTTVLKFLLDGVIYGLVTACAFAWLWP